MTDTRSALLRAATGLLDRGGAARVTLREVGAASGVSHNAPYKHFADKEELLAAVAAAELVEYARILDRAPSLTAAAEAYVDRLVMRPHRFRLVYGPWTREHDELARAADTAWERLLAAVAAAQESGELVAGSPPDAANLLRSAAHGAADLELGGHLSKGGSATSAQVIVRRLLATLAPRHG